MMPRLTSRLQPLAMLLTAALAAFLVLLLTGCRSSAPPAAGASDIPRSSTPPARLDYAGVLAGTRYRADARAWAVAENARQGQPPAPRKLKGGAVYAAPGATVTASTAKNAVAAADSAQVVSVKKAKQVAQAGPGASITQVPPVAGWLKMGAPLVAGALLLWLVAGLLKRRSSQAA